MKRRASETIARFARAHWPPMIIAAFILALHKDMIFGDIPGTGDHMIHLFRGWLMAEHLLPTGRISGWTHLAFAGYPAGVYYPVLGDLIVALFRYATLGLFSWERTYTLAFLMLLVAMPISVYAVGRRVAGPIGALTATVLSLGDVGGWPQGGHFSTVLWAVWPFMLGLTLTWFAMLAGEPVMERTLREAPGRFLLFTALLALAVLAHPMTIFFLGITAPLFILFHLVARRSALAPYRAVGRMAAAAGIAILLTLFWTLSWITSSTEWTFAWPNVGFGGLWYSLPQMWSRLFDNTLFKNFYWVTLVLGVAGAGLGLASRRLWPTFLAVLLIVAFVATGLCYELGDSPMGRRAQIERMAPFLKFLWFVLAGFAVDRAGSVLLWLTGRLPERVRANPRVASTLRAAPLVAGIAVIGALVGVGWQESFGKIITIGKLGGPLWQNIQKAEKWVGGQPHGVLDRVLYQPGMRCVDGEIASEACNEVYHRHIFASGPIRTHLPKLKFGYEATAIFKNMPLRHRWPADAFLIRRMLLEPAALENLHVRWIISVVDWPPRHDMKEARRFGNVVVYSVESGQGPPVKLTGPGTVAVQRFEDERIAVEVRGAAPGTRLWFPVAYYYPWHAYHDGRPIPIGLHGVLPNVNPVLMDVEARDGVTELRYERPLFERVASWVSLVSWTGLLAAAIALGARRRKRS